MKLYFKIIISVLIAIIFILILISKIETRICTVCGVQDYNVSIKGKTIETLSQREYDEFGTHKKYIKKFGVPHKPHKWLLIEEKNRDIIKVIDSL